MQRSWIVPSTCQGTWSFRLTVTDDDTPPKTASGETVAAIGTNRPQSLCIDYPTTLTPQLVQFSEKTDIPIHYHLDPALYNSPILHFLRAIR